MTGIAVATAGTVAAAKRFGTFANLVAHSNTDVGILIKGSGISTAGFQFHSSGLLNWVNDNAGFTHTPAIGTEWLDQEPNSSIAALYEIECVKTAGTAPTLLGMNDSTWYAASTSPQVYIQRLSVAGTYTAVFTVNIRPIGGSIVKSVGSFQLSVNL